jgi:hypothetical protein
VAAVVLGALAVAGLLAAFVTTQLAEVAGSLTGYQANLQQKIQDIRGLSEGGGAVSRFLAMVASLGHDLTVTAGPAAAPAVRVQSGGSSLESLAAFVAPLLHPLLTVGIVVILVVFILLGRDHLGDQFIRPDEVLDFIAADEPDGAGAVTAETDRPASGTGQPAREVHAFFRCVGGRGQIDDAARHRSSPLLCARRALRPPAGTTPTRSPATARRDRSRSP